MISVRADALVLLVGHIHAAGKAYLAIADQNLAVGPKVDHRPQPPPYLGVVKAQYLCPSLLQRLQKCSPQFFGSQRIDQKPNLHTGLRLFNQQIAQRRARLVGLVDVVLQMHMVARGVHSIGNRIESGGASHQQLHGGGRTHREIAGHAYQPGHLTQPFLLCRNTLPEFLHAAAHTRALSGAQSLDALALHALRPEVVIDHQADHRQSRHGQQPA